MISTGAPMVHDTRGATAVEYALLVVLIAGVIIAVVGFLGQDVQDLFAIADW